MNPNIEFLARMVNKQAPAIEALWRQAKKHAAIDHQKTNYVRAFRQLLVMLKVRGLDASNIPDDLNVPFKFIGQPAVIQECTSTFMTVYLSERDVTLYLPLANLLFGDIWTTALRSGSPKSSE